MNKPVIAGIAAGVLLAAFLIVAPLGISSPAAAQVTSTGKTKTVTLIAMEKVLQVAPDDALHPGGVMYNAMTFNGTIPGPVIAVDQGDNVRVTLKNEGKTIHSIDFHAAIGPSQVLSGNIAPNSSKTWTFNAPNAGFFYYHCGADALNGVWEHIANGMYGGVVVHAPTEKPAKEFYVAFGEIYSNNIKGPFIAANGTGSFDLNKFYSDNPDLKVTNGEAFKYVPSIGQAAKIELNKNATVFKVKPGELTRWYILNGGPNDYVAFHFIAGQFDIRDGSIGDANNGRLGSPELHEETWTVPPGSGSVFESVFPEAGTYVGVDHAMVNVLKGGAFAVVATNNSTDNDQPPGTAVAPKGSASVVASNVTTVMPTPLAPTTPTPPATPTKPSNATGPVNATTATNVTAGKAPSANATTNATSATTNATSATTNATSTAAAAGGGNSVKIVSGAATKTTDAFSPNPLEVKVGTNVTWTNGDTQPHTVTSGTGPSDTNKGKEFDTSPNLNPLFLPGKTFSHTFSAAGTFPYFCQLHPNMVGSVKVS